MTMKTVAAPRLIRCVGIALLFIAGCKTDLKLTVVDSFTGRPVNHVDVVWKAESAKFFSGQRRQKGPLKITRCDDDSAFIVNRVPDGWIGRVVLSKSGYTTIYGIYSGGKLGTSDRVTFASYEDFILTAPVVDVPWSNGCLLINMSPKAK